MRLREALVKASLFAWRGREQAPLRCVRLLPAHAGRRAAVYAADGTQSILIYLDDGVEVPNAMVDAPQLRKVIRHVRDVAITEVVNGTLQIAGVYVNSGNVREYPGVPTIPESGYGPIADWPLVASLLHIASKDDHQPLLQCLNFRRDVVDVTDRFRIGRAFVSTPVEALLPAGAFRAWPAGDHPVDIAMDGPVAVLRVADEVRFVTCRTGKFQRCDELLPPSITHGAKACVDTSMALSIIERVKGMGQHCKVTVGGGVLFDADGLSEVVDGLPGNDDEPVTLRINASWLRDALRAVHTPRLWMAASDGGPLRLEFGPMVIGIWPLMGG